MTSDQWLVLAGIVVAAIVGSLPVWQARRRDEREREQAGRDAVSTAIKEALTPVYRELDQIRDDMGGKHHD